VTAAERIATPVLLAGVLAVGACGRPTLVEVVASLGPGQPLAGLEVVAWPYDPQRLLDSLASLAPGPRPDFTELETELRAFRRPEFAEDDERTQAWAAVRDSVRRLSDSLSALDRRAPGYAAAYDRFRRLYERFQQHTAARDAGVRELTTEVRALGLRAGRAADSLRGWERVAFVGHDSAAALALANARRPVVIAVTDVHGNAALTLPAGAWWMEAHVPHPENPFIEYRWLIPAVTAGLPFRVGMLMARANPTWRH
jgi:hypothetical protein